MNGKKILMVMVVIVMMMVMMIILFYRDYYSTILFLDKDETIALLLQNDSFYRHFHKNDLVARRVESVDDYKNRIIVQCGCTPSLYERIRLALAIREADRRMSRIREKWFDGEKAARLKWKIACTKGVAYENGYPHTIDDTIVISREIVMEYSFTDLVETLMHEKTHIYQKRYREDVERYLSEHQFDVVKRREKEDNIRSNPDIDEMVYIHQPSGDVYKLTYREHPKTISDTIEKGVEKEHPYEEMAMKIEKM